MTFPSHYTFKQTTLTTCVLAALSLTAASNVTAVEPDIRADYNISYGLGDKGQLLAFPKVGFSLTNSEFGPNTIYEGVDSLAPKGNSIAITTTGDAITWKINPFYWPSNNNAPISLGLTGVEKIGVAFALTSTGEVYTWGWEDWNSQTLVPPTKVKDQSNVALSNIQNISSGYRDGYDRSSALTDMGEVYAFEYSSWHNPPASTANKVMDAISMMPITGITDIDQQLALNSAGQVYHWRINGSSSFASLVKDEFGITLSGITQIDYNQSHLSTALNSGGQVYTWGKTSQAGNIVLTAANLVKDTNNVPIADVKELLQTAALTNSGEVYDWKWNYVNGEYVPSSAMKVLGLSDVKEVETEQYYQWIPNGRGGVALTNGGEVFTWQWDNTRNQPLAAQKLPLEGVIKISASETHSLALKSDGDLCGWGDNAYGQLGSNNPNPVPMTNPVCGLADLIDETACVIDELPEYSRINKKVTFSNIAMELYTPWDEEARDKYALVTSETEENPLYLEELPGFSDFKFPKNLVMIPTGEYIEGTDHCYPVYSAERETLDFKVKVPLVTALPDGTVVEGGFFECYDVSMKQAITQPEVFRLNKADEFDCE